MTQAIQNQKNTYAVIFSCGKQSENYFIASNIKEAYKLAKESKKNFGNYWKLKRIYNGGVRG